MRADRRRREVRDVGMPGEDGYAPLRRLRALAEQGGAIPALSVTAYTREVDRHENRRRNAA